MTQTDPAPLTVIVGAGPGMGLALARCFGEAGHRLALLARRADQLFDFREQLTGEGYAVDTYVADAADADALGPALDQLLDDLGTPEVLVYNAVRHTRAALLDVDAATLATDYGVSVLGAWQAARVVAPRMIEAGRGTILFTGGGMGLNPQPGFGSLAMSKGALRNLTAALAQELAPSSIHVATVTIAGSIAPGTAFDPAAIAEVYLALHEQPAGAWDSEIIYTAEVGPDGE